MKRLIGFAFICMAIGMFIVLLMPTTSLLRFFIFIGCLVTGYFLFCK